MLIALHLLAIDEGLLTAAVRAVDVRIARKLRALRLHLDVRFLARLLALGASLGFGGVAVVVIAGVGQRRSRGRARQEKGDEEFTHDHDLSSRIAVESLPFQMSRGLTVSGPYIQVCRLAFAGGAVCAARAIALRMRG